MEPRSEWSRDTKSPRHSPIRGVSGVRARTARLVLPVLAGGLALAACSSSAGSTPATGGGSTGSTAATAAGGRSPASGGESTGSTGPTGSTGSTVVPLVVYSAQGYDKAETTAFQKATGIQVRLDDNSTGPLLTQIEASKNNPNWGLLWVDGPTAFAGLDQQGLLLKRWEPTVNWNSLGSANLPADRSYIPTGVTLVAALVYDKTKVSKPADILAGAPRLAVEG